MSISIQTNVNSLVAQQNMNVNSTFQSKTIQQLTSGYRINQSGDDAAGLAVANKFRSSVAELSQGVANGNDGLAQLQIMDGGMNNISQILDRLKTLATQSASGAFTGSRDTLNTEFQNDLAEIDRQAQSIGLNTGGTFARSLDVYLGQGSGSASLSNGLVTLSLAQSTVDSQSLGMKGVQVVNTNTTTGAVLQDIGTNSSDGTSVAAILANAGSGSTNNKEAVAGYAAFQFSGAGFSDDGKIGVSVNLAGVTDVVTLATAVNTAIKQAGTIATPSATAFQGASVVASVYTDSQGKQALAFSSNSSAFQVQAGDQMANALLGNVSMVANGGDMVAQGDAVVGAAVTGANTTAGNFTNGQTVKLVVTGGGLDSPVTLSVNTGTGTPSTAQAISDLETQFSGNTSLQSAGLTMSGDALTVGSSALSFQSATGQTFNVQVTGDTSNLLGLGSFLTNASGAADYSSILSGAYDRNTVSGTANMQVSINGAAPAASLAGIDLSAGANATVASISGGAVGNGGVVTFASGANNITIDGSTATHTFGGTTAISLTATSAATSGAVAGTAAGGITYDGGTDSLHFDIEVDASGSAHTISLAPTATDATSGKTQSTKTNAGGASAIDYSDVSAINNKTFEIAVDGDSSAHSITLGAAAGPTSGTLTGSSLGSAIDASLDNLDGVTFDVTVNGVTAHIDLGTDLVNNAQDLLDTINGQLQDAGLNVTVETADAGKALKFVNSDTGAASNITVDAVDAGTNSKLGLVMATGDDGADRTGVQDDATLLAQLNGQLGTYGAHASFDANNGGRLTISSDTTGAGSSVAITNTQVGTLLGVNNVAATVAHGADAVTADSVDSDATLLTKLNSQLGQYGAHAFFDSANSDKLTVASNSTGATSKVAITNTNASAAAAMGIADTSAVSGHAATATINDIAAQIQTALGANAKVTVAGGALTIASVNKGAGETFTVTGGNGAGSSASLGSLTMSATAIHGASSSTKDIVDNLNQQFGANSTYQKAGLTAVQTDSSGAANAAGTYIKLVSNNGTQFRLNSLASGTDIGFGNAGISFVGQSPTATTSMSSLNAQGVSQTGVQSFSALQYGSDKQALTFSAMDSRGVLETATITLDNSTGKSIDDAVAYINQTLQKSTDKPALQQIVAVKQNNGAEGINFVSSLSSFTVGVSATANSGDGLAGGAATNLGSTTIGSGANMSIASQAGALAAVAAVNAAVGKLGSAQAAVGKGENQLGYAINLAQAQITNFSAAEAQIRDANIAQQAANMTKAQVLQQATIAAMAQANSAPQAVLKLLQG